MSSENSATQPVPKLSVIAVASLASDPNLAVAGNSLTVASLEGGEPRIYWKGERLNGTIDNSKPMARSVSYPFFTMLIDGRSVVYGTNSVGEETFSFRGETLTNHGGGFPVGYDEVNDRPVF